MSRVIHRSSRARWIALAMAVLALVTFPVASAALAQTHQSGGEANLRIPDLSQVSVGGMNSRTLLGWGLGVCVLGLIFGLVIFAQLRRLPVHESMREISELIYETCKTYLITQGKFILLLEVFIGVIMLLYFGVLLQFEAVKVVIILLFSLIGIAGSYGVAWFGIRINTFANSRTAFASLEGKPFPVYAIPLKAGHEHRDAPHQRGAVPDALYLAVRPRRLRGAVLHRLRHRGVAVRGRPPDRRRHLHQDRRHRLRPHEDRLQHQGGRRPQPRGHRRLHGRQRRRLRGAERRRLRDLRGHGRGPHLLHPARRAPGDDPGPAPGVDLRHAGHDDRGQRRLLPGQRGHGPRAATPPRGT